MDEKMQMLVARLRHIVHLWDEEEVIGSTDAMEEVAKAVQEFNNQEVE